MGTQARNGSNSSLQENSQRYPLSSVQQGVWMDQMRAPELPDYNIGMAVLLEGDLDAGLLKRAVQCSCQRHDAMRTVLRRQGESELPMQEVLAEIEAPFTVIDCSTQKDPEEAARQFMHQAMREPFMLEDGVLWKSLLLVISEWRHYPEFDKFPLNSSPFEA